MADICQCRRQTNWQLLAGRVMTVAIWETNKLRHDYYSYKQVCFNVINYPDTGGPAPACIGISMHLTWSCSSIYLIVFFFCCCCCHRRLCPVLLTLLTMFALQQNTIFHFFLKKKKLLLLIQFGGNSINHAMIELLILSC